MQHDGTVASPVFTHKFCVQALRHVGVYLDGAALPGATQGVFQRVFDLGAVEGALARQILKFTPGGAQAFGQGGLGAVPAFLSTNALRGAGRNLVDDVVEAKVRVHLLQQHGEGLHLALDLVFGTENVAIILCKGPHAHDAMQAARRLVAMAGSEFAKAQRQVAVALDAVFVDQDVAGAVHRLQGIVALFRFGDEHVLAVLVPVAGLLPQPLVQDLRTLDFLVAIVLVDLAHVLLHALPQRPALGVPEHGARGMLVNVKQVQLAPQLAVVSLFGLFQHS